MRRFIDNPYVLWAVLAAPGLWLTYDQFVAHGERAFSLSGIWSCWLLVLTMAVTPLEMIFGPLPWLRRSRRYFGVASFFYASLHTLIWLLGVHMWQIIASFTRPSVVPGWIGYVIFVLLAITSTDGWVRRLGPRWKWLQRWIYPAAFLTFVHWVMTTEHVLDAWLWSVPIMVAGVWRLWRHQKRMRRA
ncbi:MAG: ferric reductase-like transmembrane domain-containing protein [Rhodobacteraceae bacterium]|nr:ferric reductase-like transmembrane domain-containing protein [Paracoccaceae bacterium]